jgi:hypothetical protein
MRMRGMVGWMAALLLAQVATATPLCRDSKGLFTPCPQGANSTARAILNKAPARNTESPTARKQPAAATATMPPVAARATFAADTPHKARLCTDSKGLFTPCAR